MVLHADDNRSKIVCTIGPASRSLETLRLLVREGMDVARLNFSHGSHDDHGAVIDRVRQVAREENATIALLADLQGPKLRIGRLGSPLTLATGDWFTLSSDAEADGRGHVVPLPHIELFSSLQVGGRLLFDDGKIEAVVKQVGPRAIVAQMTVGGTLSSHKGIAAPGGTSEVEALTDKDRDDAAYAVSRNVDYVALSFVRSAEDINRLRDDLDRLDGGSRIQIVAKIEKQEAIEHLDEILAVSDAVMVARGDLGIEISPQEVPMHQKEIIRRCNRLGKPVITATQMLLSMIDNPRPTRAEASDVANAILDGTDAVMLSEETAMGRYPVQAVSMMREIATIAEHQMPSRLDDIQFAQRMEHDHPVTDAISDCTVRIAEQIDARLIATSTWSGYTARQIARERPKHTIVALTPNEKVVNQLALVWGVVPLLLPAYDDTDQMLKSISVALKGAGYADAGDVIVISAGIPTGGGGKTNLIKVHRLP